MAYKKPSPAKFINAIFGAGQRRREQRAANEDLGNQMDSWEDTKMTNPYAGVQNPYADMENVYEDQTVDLKAAEFQKEQSQQSMANIMATMKTASGGSGVAGLAQVLANQGVKQARQASADIGRQEQQNQARAMQESSRLQDMDRKGEQKRDMLEREGARMVEQYDMQKQEKMLDMAMQRQSAAQAAVDADNAALDKAIVGGVTGGLQGLLGG